LNFPAQKESFNVKTQLQQGWVFLLPKFFTGQNNAKRNNEIF